MKRKAARFDIKDILPIGLTLVVTGIGVAYGLDILGDQADDFLTEAAAPSCGRNASGGTGGTLLYNNCSVEWNTTQDAIAGVAKLPEKLPLIVNVIVAAIIIGILVRYLMVRFG